MSVFNLSTRQAIYLALAVCLAVESALFAVAYLSAFSFLSVGDRGNGGGMAGTILFANDRNRNVQIAGFVNQSSNQGSKWARAWRIVISPEGIRDSDLLRAVISSEDKRFFEHNGISGPAMIKGLMEGRGGSTITQQWIKNRYLDSSRTLSRKFKELVLALAAERLFTKEQIAAGYFNHCYMGEASGRRTAIYGFGAASREFFGKDVSKLTLAESAALAAMVNQPAEYLRAARRGDYGALLERRERVLNLMRENFPDRYSEQAVKDAKDEPLKFVFAGAHETPERQIEDISKPFQNYALKQMRQEAGAGQSKADCVVVMTLDPSLQRAAQEAVGDVLPKFDSLVEFSRAKKRLPDRSERLQAAVVAMDPKTGEILAMVGNRGDIEFNHADADHSPGSVIKPFVYLMALSHGLREDGPFTALSIIDPDIDEYDDYYPGSNIGTRATAREHLARSYNFGAVHAARVAGLSSVSEFWRRLTMRRQAPVCEGRLSIGGSAGTEVSPLILASAYSIFANNGLQLRPTAIRTIKNDGIEQPLSRSRPVWMAEAAPTYIAAQMMRSALEPEGTANQALRLANLPEETPVVAKTGTGQISSVHFVSVSPKLVVVVWVGLPDNRLSLDMNDGFSSAAVAAPIWAEFMRNGVKRFRSDLLEGEFQRPKNVKVLSVDRRRGCVTDSGEATELFIAGREPVRCSQAGK